MCRRPVKLRLHLRLRFGLWNGCRIKERLRIEWCKRMKHEDVIKSLAAILIQADTVADGIEYIQGVMIACSGCYESFSRSEYERMRTWQQWRQCERGSFRLCPGCAKNAQEKNAETAKRAQEEMLQCSRTDCNKYLPRRK